MAEWSIAHQAPLSRGFPRQEYWSGLPFPSSGDLLTQGSNFGLLNGRQILDCLSHQGGLLLRDISKCKDRSTLKYQQIHMALNAYNIYYLVLYTKSLLTPA